MELRWLRKKVPATPGFRATTEDVLQVPHPDQNWNEGVWVDVPVVNEEDDNEI